MRDPYIIFGGAKRRMEVVREFVFTQIQIQATSALITLANWDLLRIWQYGYDCHCELCMMPPYLRDRFRRRDA